jgi:hypothetical protein
MKIARPSGIAAFVIFITPMAEPEFPVVKTPMLSMLSTSKVDLFFDK